MSTNPYEAKARAEKALRLADSLTGDPTVLADAIDLQLIMPVPASGQRAILRDLANAAGYTSASEATWRTCVVLLRARAKEMAR